MTETDNDMGPGLDRTLNTSHQPQAEADADQLLYADIRPRACIWALASCW